MNRISVTNFFVNTIVTALQTPEWELLLARIGPTAMLHLLTETSIFVPLPNDCYCQVAGDFLVHRKAPALTTNNANRPQALPKNSHEHISDGGMISCKRKADPEMDPMEHQPAKRRRLTLSRSTSSAFAGSFRAVNRTTVLRCE
ncbi:hypothetical protein PUNSTDRAFT_66150 [Punctularia strigosozonata HHB-11173 SS5]|uniref:uncharacterized protein n=1 Tax=Punctularia strigosozonata (strain HHB-11173) TaxID=741275 RepID=UPI0004416FF2|nr:uncharacterized protein PUNSTDRAFT_66150 [Punctularia strigosozonata HHB-11173 SS5]EIN09704.1 hypothetical protein PUNSTDRAFT_66150 [Punctularia strigosozonata HHB-11173 SS5]